MKGIDVIVEQAGSRYQVAVVRVLGQIDTTTSHELERRLQFLLKDRQFEIIIDLSKVSYISSAGWGIFISEIRGIRESGGDLKLACMTPEVTEVFELLEFHNILESFRTVQDAVERFEKHRLAVQEQEEAEETVAPGTSEEQSMDETGVSTAREDVAAEEGVDASEKGAAVPEGTQSQGIVGTASGTASSEKMSDESGIAEGTVRGASESSQRAQTEAGVATELMEPGGQTATEALNETELEIVDPLNPDVKMQIRAEVIEEPQLAQACDTEASGNSAAQDAADAEPENQEPDATRAISKEFELMILETVREHPEFGCLKIRGELVRRGYREPINPLSLFMELKRLNLETKEKRKHYADSFMSEENKG